jgi:predicted transcriptional regulator
MDIRTQRITLGMSQSRLARLSTVSRFKICMHELGDKPLNEEEFGRIESALRAEARRLARMASQVGQELAPAP